MRRKPPVATVPPWVVIAGIVATLAMAGALLFGDIFLVAACGVIFGLVGGTIVFYKPHVGLLIIMTTMLVSYPSALKGVGPLTINNMLGLALMLILAFQVYRSHDYWFMREPEIRMLFVVAGLLLFTLLLSILILPNVKHMLPKILMSRDSATSYGDVDVTKRWIFELLSRIAFTIFFINYIKTRRQLLIVLIIFSLCIIAVVPTIGIGAIKGVDNTRITSKLVGWAENANRFAFMVNVGIALFIWLAHTTRSIPLILAALAGAAGCVPLVLMTASRSGFIGLGIVGLMVAWNAPLPRHWKIWGLLAGFILAVLVFFFVLPPEHQERLLNLNPFNRTQGEEGTRSTEQRVATLEDAILIIQHYPVFGVGLGNFRWFNEYLHGSWKPPHNSYVWSWAEGGIFTTLAYLVLFSFLYARIQRLRKKYTDDPVLPHLPEFLNIYIVLFFFFSIFADVWLEVHIYFIIAFSVVLSRWAEDEELRSRGLPGLTLGTPGERHAGIRALYRPRAVA